jgi:uncharacterized membrane protein
VLRQGLSVIAGFAVWSVVWLAGNALLVELHVLPHGQATPVQDAGALLALLVTAVIASLSAGYVAKMVRPSDSMRPVLVLGALLVAVGALVQSSYADLIPLWYHIAFLALLLPVCLAGAKLYQKSVDLRITPASHFLAVACHFSTACMVLLTCSSGFKLE